MRLLIIFLFVSVLGYCQDDNDVDTVRVISSNSLTGIYSRTSSVQYTLTYLGDNTITMKTISLNSVTNYSLVYGDKLVGNEFQQRTNIGDNNFFINHIYNNSLVRGIVNENSFGVGYIYRFNNFSLSYGSLYQSTDNRLTPDKEIYRHSFRVKVKYRVGYIGMMGEYYYQPNMIDMGDVIIYGNMRITLFQGKLINLTITDNLNYRSLSDVKLIHNFLFGIGFNITN